MPITDHTKPTAEHVHSLLPHTCEDCGKKVQRASMVCTDCLEALLRHRDNSTQMGMEGENEGNVKESEN